MVIDPLLNKGLVGSVPADFNPEQLQQFHNSAGSCIFTADFSYVSYGNRNRAYGVYKGLMFCGTGKAQNVTVISEAGTWYIQSNPGVVVITSGEFSNKIFGTWTPTAAGTASSNASGKYHNATECYDYITQLPIACDPTKCYDDITGFEINCGSSGGGFSWAKFSNNASNVLLTLGNLLKNLTNTSNTGNMTPEQQQAYLLRQKQLNNTKILGMSATTGAVVITTVVLVGGFLGYRYISKHGIPAPSKVIPAIK